MSLFSGLGKVRAQDSPIFQVRSPNNICQILVLYDPLSLYLQVARYKV